MNRLIEFAVAALASGSAAHRVGAVAQRGVAGMACVALATGLGAAACGCGAAALWLYVAAALGPVAAALITAAALLAAAVLLLAAARLLVRSRRPPPVAAPAGLNLGDFALSDFARLMTEHKGALLIAAAILGMLAGSDEKRPKP